MSSVLAQLRSLAPPRPLTVSESLVVAEHQAQRLLSLRGVTEASVPSGVITELPRIQVEHFAPMPMSGATDWGKGRWLIVLNANESEQRQRFSLAHEYKHVLDHPAIKVLYPALPALTSHERAEHVCDYFAACLLMPRPLIKRAFTTRTQSITHLAGMFDVSRQAMTVRLQQIGLIDRTQRCHGSKPASFDVHSMKRYARRQPTMV